MFNMKMYGILVSHGNDEGTYEEQFLYYTDDLAKANRYVKEKNSVMLRITAHREKYYALCKSLASGAVKVLDQEKYLRDFIESNFEKDLWDHIIGYEYLNGSVWEVREIERLP